MKAQDRIDAARSKAKSVIKRKFGHRPTKGDLTYEVSRWNRYLYNSERRHNTGLRENEIAGVERNERYPDFQRELFSRIYNPNTPQLDEPADGTEWASKLHQFADDLPEFRSLQEQCKGDELWSGMATTTVAKSIVEKTEPQESNEDIGGLERTLESLEDLQGNGVGGLEGRIEKAKQKLDAAREAAEALAAGLDPATIRNALRQACEHAKTEINNAQDTMEALSFGDTPGAPTGVGNIDAKRRLAKLLKDNPKLREIAKLAGRLRRVALDKQRSKCEHAKTEINNVELGGDIERLLASEYLNLALDDEDREALFFARLAERKSLQYRLSGSETEGRGPIVVCIDSSGSMSGQSECWAKAVLLAMLEVARKQKRTLAVVHFDTVVQRVDRFERGEIDEHVLFETLAFFTGGGTRFQPALDQACGIITDEDDYKKADILLITDGQSDTMPEWDDRFKRWKDEAEASVFTVLIGSYASVTGKWSDKTFKYADILKSGNEFESVAFSV